MQRGVLSWAIGTTITAFLSGSGIYFDESFLTDSALE